MIGNWNYGTGRRKTSVARVFMKKVQAKSSSMANPLTNISLAKQAVWLCVSRLS